MARGELEKILHQGVDLSWGLIAILRILVQDREAEPRNNLQSSRPVLVTGLCFTSVKLLVLTKTP